MNRNMAKLKYKFIIDVIEQILIEYDLRFLTLLIWVNFCIILDTISVIR